MLSQIDVRKEQRRASQIQFASAASPELLQLARPKQGKVLETAQEGLKAVGAAGGAKLATQALAEKAAALGSALSILAQYELRGHTIGACAYYEQGLSPT